MKKITVIVDGQGDIEVDVGTTLEQLSKEFKDRYSSTIVAATVNNHLRELSFPIQEHCNVKFLDLTTADGLRVYTRSLAFLFIRASKEVLPGCRVTVEHSLSKGLYCEIHYERPIEETDVRKIEERMRDIVKEDVPFVKDNISVAEAKEIFKREGLESKVKLLDFRKDQRVNIYSCGDLKDYFYGYMVPSTGYLKLFELKHYAAGVIVRYPEISDPNRIPPFVEQKKLASIFRESERWGQIMELPYVANLNEFILHKKHPELIRIAEALHEKKVAQIADEITKEGKRIILIAGPSSSGKTTFAQRLAIQLKVNGLRPVSISTDDYFVDREHTPKDEWGEYDFESIEAVDLELFNEQLSKLLQGEEVEIPIFNFQKGAREFRGRIMKITSDQPIIIEGIHGLNERLTEGVPSDQKFKIYISALTQLNIDEYNRIPTTDTRLIRRIVRDSKYRGHSALKTLNQWPSVRRGEEKNIFPFQEEADVMFNSALVYELAVLKKYVEPLLHEITDRHPEYSEAKRLLKFLSYFIPIDDEHIIPQTSIIREFIGGSCFEE